MGTIITLITCWFLWRGSRAAYWFYVITVMAALIYAIWAYTHTQYTVVAVLCGFVCILLLALVVPATRRFLSYRRATRA